MDKMGPGDSDTILIWDIRMEYLYNITQENNMAMVVAYGVVAPRRCQIVYNNTTRYQACSA